MPGGARGTRGSTQGGGLGQGRGRRGSNLTCGNAQCGEFGTWGVGHLVDSEEDEDPFAFLVPNHEQVFMAMHEGKARHEGNEPMAYGALDTCGLGGGAFVLQGGNSIQFACWLCPSQTEQPYSTCHRAGH